jgi:hypothetical protein
MKNIKWAIFARDTNPIGHRFLVFLRICVNHRNDRMSNVSVEDPRRQGTTYHIVSRIRKELRLLQILGYMKFFRPMAYLVVPMST